MTTQHTPGPWMTGDDKPMVNQHGGRTRFVWDILTCDGRPVAAVSVATGVDAMTQGNARLIAAAPELLDACRRAVQAMDGLLVLSVETPNNDMHERFPWFSPWLYDMRTAIAKAEGGTS